MKLAAFEIAWAKIALAAMFPGSPENGLEGIGAMDVPGYLNDVMRTRPFRATLGLRAAIWLIALAPLVVLRRASTIAGVDAGERERILDGLLVSRFYSVRMLVMLLKTFGALFYAGNAGVRARLRPVPAGSPRVTLRLRRSPIG